MQVSIQHILSPDRQVTMCAPGPACRIPRSPTPSNSFLIIGFSIAGAAGKVTLYKMNPELIGAVFSPTRCHDFEPTPSAARGCDNDHLTYTMLAGRIDELYPSLTCAHLGRTTLDNADSVALPVGLNGKTQACDACTNHQYGNACLSITFHLRDRCCTHYRR